MPWSALQAGLRRLSTPIRYATAAYALLLTGFTLVRLLRLIGPPPLDLANAFAPYLYMPLVISFPLAIIVTRQAGTAKPAKAKPGQASDETRGRRWNPLLHIGLIVFGLYSFALPAMYQQVDPPSGQTISVISFNVQGSNIDLRLATDWLLSMTPDLIALQETAPGFDGRLAPLYEQYAHEDHIAGNARVFSRFPILRREALFLDAEGERAALRLELDAHGARLAVYAIHLSAPFRAATEDHPAAHIGPGLLLRYDESRRNAQIAALLERLESESQPFIVAGDFNMSDASLIYDRLAADMRDAWRGAGNGAGRTFPVAEAIGLPRVVLPFLRLDYIWHSESLRATAAEIGPPIGSDHLPLRAEIAL